MKATSIKEYQNKISAWHVTLFGNWTESKPKFLEICAFFRSMQFLYSAECRAEIVVVLFYRCRFYLAPKVSWPITYSWLQLSYTYTYSYTQCFGCSFAWIYWLNKSKHFLFSQKILYFDLFHFAYSMIFGLAYLYSLGNLIRLFLIYSQQSFALRLFNFCLLTVCLKIMLSLYSRNLNILNLSTLLRSFF